MNSKEHLEFLSGKKYIKTIKEKYFSKIGEQFFTAWDTVDGKTMTGIFTSRTDGTCCLSIEVCRIDGSTIRIKKTECRPATIKDVEESINFFKTQQNKK